jgi:hypothetical protein
MKTGSLYKFIEDDCDFSTFMLFVKQRDLSSFVTIPIKEENLIFCLNDNFTHPFESVSGQVTKMKGALCLYNKHIIFVEREYFRNFHEIVF